MNYTLSLRSTKRLFSRGLIIQSPINHSRHRRPALTLLAGILLAVNAQACGPFFSPVLIDDRAAALTQLPEGDIYVAMENLLPAKEKSLVADEASLVETVELQGLTQEHATQLKALRASANPESDAGANLPPAIRLYTQGALAFNAAHEPLLDQQDADVPQPRVETVSSLAVAQEKFLAVLALPDAEKKSRALWATFMLGRIAAEVGDFQKSDSYFEQVRSLAAEGYTDNLGLAVATYGLQAQRFYLIATGESVAVAGVQQEPISKLVAYQKAVHLYAQQAAYDARSARDSLRMTMDHLMDEPQLAVQLMDDPLVQQLLFAYAFSGYFNDQARLELLAQLEQKKVTAIPNADQVAAFAYRQGRADLAEHFVQNSTSPLAWWVKAKLALQKGDFDTALTAYTQAAKAFPAEERWASSNVVDDYSGSDVSPQCLVNAELGLLQLQRSEYLQALHYLYQGAKEYWMDAAYVAERIVTTDELKQFVDEQVPAASVEAAAEAQNWSEPLPATKLRKLLARRLMRDQRYSDAIGYFDNTELQQQARRYGDYMARAQAWWLPDSYKAQALFNASQLARYQGMELMGYEGAPDYAVWEGLFEYGTPDELTVNQWVSAGEKQRFDASQAKPEKRYHYRFIAATLAGQAADMLPPRSQAFAAALCEQSHYLLARYPQEAAPIYQRYLKQGAYVPWGQSFGQDCPAPEFGLALWQYPREKIAQLKRYF